MRLASVTAASADWRREVDWISATRAMSSVSFVSWVSHCRQCRLNEEKSMGLAQPTRCQGKAFHTLPQVRVHEYSNFPLYLQHLQAARVRTYWRSLASCKRGDVVAEEDQCCCCWLVCLVPSYLRYQTAHLWKYLYAADTSNWKTSALEGVKYLAGVEAGAGRWRAAPESGGR